jgi:putative hydrolase of the HAD superfamily
MTPSASPMLAPRGFDRIDTWVFDLDNTLYPHGVELWRQIDLRIREFIAGFLNLDPQAAFRVQKDYYRRYGTSMRGLMIEHGLEPDEYLSFVHAIDHSSLAPNPALGAAIENLRGRKLILTNGTRSHARAVLERLSIAQYFDDVFDIVAAQLEPKPLPQIYQRFLAAHAVEPTRTAMFEDLVRNLSVPHALGMTTVLVMPDITTRKVERETWELEGREGGDADHVTTDLVGFLERIVAPRGQDRPGR